MASATRTHRSSIYWPAALWAGLIAGVVFLIVPHAIPWVGSGVTGPSVMGRQLGIDATLFSGAGLGLAAFHLLLGVIYALIIVSVVARMSSGPAVLAGGAVGLVLYLLNYLAFALAMEGTQTETAPAMVHVAFGLLAAAVYKGLSGRREEM